MVVTLGPDEVDRAAAALARGELVAFPTETVYGLGADASSPAAVARIFAAKGRPTGHPLIVHIAERADLDRFGVDVSAPAKALAEAFWPGPLTLIVGRGDRVAPEATGGRDTVGLRVPDHPLTRDLLGVLGRGIAGPSANRFGSVSPTTAAHVIDDLGHAIEYVLDGGPCRVGLESTIVDTTGPEPVLLRPGGISAVEIEAVLGQPLLDDRGGPARASGMLASHYAPSVPVRLVEPDDLPAALIGGGDFAGGGDLVGGNANANDLGSGRETGAGAVGLIAPFDHGHQPSWSLPPDAAGYGARLYATLRAADTCGLDRLVVVPPDRGELRDAVIDRLVKAAAPRGDAGP